jgi:hypothetical protein
MSSFEIIEETTFDNFYFSLKWLGIYLVYMFLGNKFFPAKKCLGFPDSKGKVLEYKINGFPLFLLTIALYFLLKLFFGFSLIPLIKYFWAFFAASNFYAFIFAGLILFFGRSSI